MASVPDPLRTERAGMPDLALLHRIPGDQPCLAASLGPGVSTSFSNSGGAGYWIPRLVAIGRYSKVPGLFMIMLLVTAEK